MNPAEAGWNAVDQLVEELMIPADPLLESILRTSSEAGLPPIQVSPAQGKLLQILASVQRARRILEIGTLGGYSTIWLARALPPEGRIITLELDPKHAQVARSSFARADVSASIDLRVGRAIDLLPVIAAEPGGPFDLIFIDADKPGTPDYFTWALQLARPGTLIVVDNVIRKGAILDRTSTDPAVRGMQRFVEMLGAEPRVSSTVIQTVGSKGYDGFALARVL